MPKARKLNRRHEIERLRRRTTRYLVLFLMLPAIVVLALTFRVGQAVWPAWIMKSRLEIIGTLLLAVLATILFSPIIIAANSDPRHLSGPGKNPEQGGDL